MLIVVSVLAAAIRAGTALVYATLGEIIMERAGILNLGLEGIMLCGALAGFITSHHSGNPWLGLGAAMAAGALLALIHGILCISLRANQVVSGLALTIFGTGICGYFGKSMVGVPGTGFHTLKIPYLSSVPLLGEVLFCHDIMIYLSFLLIPALWFLLFRTRPGLDLRSVGENPSAAESLGLNVQLIRYGSVLLGGALAGMGGAYLSLAYNHQWIDDMTAGRGWIAVALVIFSAWNPARAALGAWLFGGVDAIQFRIQAAGSTIPASLLLMLPYLLTILVLLFASRERMKKHIGAPAALGIPYEPGERT